MVLDQVVVVQLEFGIIFGAWSLRNALLWIYPPNEYTRINSCRIISVIIIIMIFSILMHKFHFNRTDWGKKIDEII